MNTIEKMEYKTWWHDLETFKTELRETMIIHSDGRVIFKYYRNGERKPYCQ